MLGVYLALAVLAVSLVLMGCGYVLTGLYLWVATALLTYLLTPRRHD